MSSASSNNSHNTSFPIIRPDNASRNYTSSDFDLVSVRLRALILDHRLRKFLAVCHEDAPIPTATKDDLLKLLASFHPGLRLDTRISEETLSQLFTLIVRPFFLNMDYFDEETNVMLYWDVPL
ncbi:uncharacterized protein MELLADRAFT_63126 [Melampsora larici-populina 98AG31]|uniref:Uncharacterized protein n=1 Tax=Melampsora larici-populina (strain 98AG31 / pathotype 3-4-7) TaxID=747676 RepID=F4RLI3_MELLP|nr:uncharacterized protein MELLADRAFT_63126 [Melampsora larici-populina 98AG31]EGG06748.1 hypothetical protein MELLADRAFT_63126 [Melampsora larici-populina 98AG31]